MRRADPDEAIKIFRRSHGGGGNDAIERAADLTVDWLAQRRYTHVMLDVCNECDLCRISKDICPQ